MGQGFLNLDKPLGITAHDCVSRIRKMLKQKQVGHSGTLDPAASGVLPIAVGQATRLIRFLPEGKCYRAKVRFGITSNTDDLDGEILTRTPYPNLSLDQIQPLLPRFTGKIEQRPPAFSAIQVGGKRLYDLARAGQPVEAPLRMVEISAIAILDWTPGEFAELDLEIDCGTGTYIRAIARDLGNMLGCGGALAGLQRTYSNGFELAQSLTFEQVSDQIQAGEQVLTKSDRPLQHLPQQYLSDLQTKAWGHGQALDLGWQPQNEDRAISQPIYHRVYNNKGQFCGIGEQRQQMLCPTVVFSANSD